MSNSSAVPTTSALARASCFTVESAITSAANCSSELGSAPWATLVAIWSTLACTLLMADAAEHGAFVDEHPDEICILGGQVCRKGKSLYGYHRPCRAARQTGSQPPSGFRTPSLRVVAVTEAGAVCGAVQQETLRTAVVAGRIPVIHRVFCRHPSNCHPIIDQHVAQASERVNVWLLPPHRELTCWRCALVCRGAEGSHRGATSVRCHSPPIPQTPNPQPSTLNPDKARLRNVPQ